MDGVAVKNELDYKRLKKLHEFDLDYKDLHDEFRNLVELAARVTQTRISLVNLIDNYTQWTVSSKFLKLSEMDRENAVCNHTINTDDFFEVPRLDKDERFSEFDYVKAEGGIKYYLGIPLKVSSGESIGALCIIDYEEKHISEESKEMLQIIAKEIVLKLENKKSLNQLQNKVGQITKQRNQLAHDLRGPISGIIGLTDNALHENLDREESESYFGMINKSASNLMELTNDILDSFREVTDENEFTLSELKRRLNNLYGPMARKKGLNFKIYTDESNKKFPRKKLIPIAGNIIANAIKFTPVDGSIEVNLKVYPQEKPQFLSLEIKDTGRGFSPQKLKEIKGVVSNGESGTEGEKSYGLGLNLVKEMVDELEGELMIDSKEGEGTKVLINIPIDSN